MESPSEIASCILGISVKFTFFEQEIIINPYTRVKLVGSCVIQSNPDSQYRLIVLEPFGIKVPDFIFQNGPFSINPRAYEIAMKLEGLVQDCDVSISCSSNSMKINICVFKTAMFRIPFRGTIIITIDIPPRRNDWTNKFHNYNYKRICQEEEEYTKDYSLALKALGLGATALCGFLLSKLIKGGIGLIVSGPVGAAIGFAV